VTARAVRSDGVWRVGLDVGPARAPVAGVSIYVSELARALDTLAPGRVTRLGVRFDGPLADSSGDEPASRLGRHGYIAWIQLFAERDGRAAGCDLIHYSNGLAPVGASSPFVVTIHDLGLLRKPLQHPAARLARIPLMVLAARRARMVVTPSEATAEDVRRLLHVRRSRLAVIPLAARTLSAGVEDRVVLERFALRAGAFILSIGTIEPRKNGVGLLAAFERLAGEDPALRLVFAGGPGWRDGPFKRALAASPVRDRVVLTGHLPDGQIAALLESCAVMAYPAFLEGFGLPVIEAMAAGVPVVTSRTSSMPEVAAGGAVLVDPTNVESIAAGIREARAEADGLGGRGRAIAARRTWLDVGRETLAAYDRALAPRP
jgi:glycosyltransferase involved in cell wall biosynthesis